MLFYYYYLTNMERKVRLKIMTYTVRNFYVVRKFAQIILCKLNQSLIS